MVFLKRLAIVFFIVFILPAPFLHSKTIEVPRDYPTIKMAVAASQNGDTVLVDDGNYFEKNIIVDKDIRILSKNLYGAVVYGSLAVRASIFIVRAKVEIGGFFLLNSQFGIVQRHSPDVDWRAHDLILMNMVSEGISVNDERTTIGRAVLENLYFESCDRAIETNDAREIQVRGCVINHCRFGVSGSNHISFTAEKTLFNDCEQDVDRSTNPAPGNVINTIVFGQDVYSTNRIEGFKSVSDFPKLLPRVFTAAGGRYRLHPDAGLKSACLADRIIGDLNFSAGAVSEANRLWARAFQAAQKAGLREMTWRIALSLARGQAKAGRDALSLDYARKAADKISSLSRGLRFVFYEESFLEGKAAIFEDLIDRLWEIDSRSPRRGFAAEAFLWAEKYKALAGGITPLRKRRTIPENRSSPSLAARLALAASEISRIQRLLGGELRGDERIREEIEKLEVAEDDFKTVFAHRYAAAVDPPAWLEAPASGIVEVARRLAGPDGAIVEYFFGLKNIYTFLLSGEGIRISKISSADRIKVMVLNYVDFLKYDGESKFTPKRAGAILYDALLGPLQLEEHPEIKKVTIVPDGVLNYLPFEALVAPNPGEFMIERYEIRYATSLADLESLAASRRRSAAKTDLLVMANAAPNQPLWGSPEITALRFVPRELAAITRLFRGAKKSFLGKDKASEADLKKLDLSGYRIIHFAAHGIFDDTFSWRSALLMDPGDEREEDGLIQTLDIIGLNLPAELVVLSSCQSGSAPTFSGKGVFGLNQAFFLAGAKSVLCSLWAINDRSTVHFMNSFYSALLGGQSAAEALRSAKLALIKSRFSHPRYWAAFVISGDCSDPLYPAPGTH